MSKKHHRQESKEREILCWSFFENCYKTYVIPSVKELLLYHSETYGEEYDEVEKQKVKGGLPLLLKEKDG